MRNILINYNIQNSQFGDDFYIDIGVHPIGLPQLITNHLQIRENISIFDCILQTRIDLINIKKNSLLHNVSHETIHILDYLSTSHSLQSTFSLYKNSKSILYMKDAFTIHLPLPPTLFNQTQQIPLRHISPPPNRELALSLWIISHSLYLF